MGYFELIRLHLSGFKEPHKSPNYGKWINSRYILADDVPLGTSVFQGPELGTSKFPSGLDSTTPNRVSSSYSTQLQMDNSGMEVTRPNLPRICQGSATSPGTTASSLEKTPRTAEQQSQIPKKSIITIAIEKQHVLIAGAVATGLAIGCMITWVWHKLKAKRERKDSKHQRRHQREWTTS